MVFDKQIMDFSKFEEGSKRFHDKDNIDLLNIKPKTNTNFQFLNCKNDTNLKATKSNSSSLSVSAINRGYNNSMEKINITSNVFVHYRL